MGFAGFVIILLNIVYSDEIESIYFCGIVIQRFPPGFSFESFDDILKSNGFIRRIDNFSSFGAIMPGQKMKIAYYDEYDKINEQASVWDQVIERYFPTSVPYCGPKSWQVYFALNHEGRIAFVWGAYRRIQCVNF